VSGGVLRSCIVDGREAVTFVVRVKECLEDPARRVLDL
jgi:2-oxoglutarate dehydrogenase E2 component (dihydrolipoamide succinyltransferase)